MALNIFGRKDSRSKPEPIPATPVVAPVAAPKKKRRKTPRALYDWLRVEEVDRLLTAAESTRDRAILTCFFYLGCRSNELRMLNVEDVDLEHSEVRILHGKGGKMRVQPIFGDTLEPALRAWLALRPDRSDKFGRGLFPTQTSPRISNRYLRTLVKKYGVKAGVGERIINQGLHPHSLRHTYATLLLHEGVDIATVSNLMGHADIAITSAYLGTDDRKRREAVAKLGAALGRLKEASK